jgi:hypothetical protein
MDVTPSLTRLEPESHPTGGYGLVKGQPEHHPEGSYYLRYLRDGKCTWHPVGPDGDAAVAAPT